MSWAESLLDASFRGVGFEVQAENYAGERALAQHGVPYRDGDDLEDLGRTARAFSVQAVLWGDNYEIPLQALIRALETAGPGELVHPIYGSVHVLARAWRVSHSAERPDYAQVDVDFLEQRNPAPFFERTFTAIEGGTDITSLAEQIASDPSWQSRVFDLFARVDSLMAVVQQYLGGGWVGLIEQVLGLPGIGLRLSQLRSQILGVVSGVAEMAGHLVSAFDPLTDLARTPSDIRAAIGTATPSDGNALLRRDSVPTSLPGGDAVPVDIARAGDGIIDVARRAQPVDADRLGLPDGLPSDPVEASGWALVTLIIIELAIQRAAAVADALEDTSQTSTMTPDELERLVNIPRTLIEGAILLQRRLYGVEQARQTIEPLRNIAALLQARARQIIVLKPPLIERTVTSRTCLRLLAHQWYGDHTRATELLRLNPSLRDPNALDTGDVLRCYAQ